ncbi:MAG TPA: hypothetical protein VFO27_18805 [Bryobacteraceae bacterium]|nr:hypothetical protein [Bryobacteraceae bacterium]
MPQHPAFRACVQPLCYHEDMTAGRMVNQGYQLVRHVVPAVMRPVRALWHEVIGFLFLALAVWPIPSGIKTLRELEGGQGSLLRLILTVAFVAIMAGYGISCFRRARKISRS